MSWKRLQQALTLLFETQQGRKGSLESMDDSPLPLSTARPPLKSKHRALPSAGFIIERDIDAIQQEIETLHDKFHALIKDLRERLDSEKKKIADVHDTLLSLPPHLNIVYLPVLEGMLHSLEKCESHRDFFLKLNTCWNFIDFELLERIVKKHGGEELKSAMNRYLDDVRKFRKCTSVHQLVEGWGSAYRPFDKEKYKKYVAQLERDPKTCTLEELEVLRKDTRYSICEQPLSTAAMILHELAAGSVTVVWLVSEEYVEILLVSISELIKTSQSDFIDRYGISFLSLDGHILYPVEEVSRNIHISVVYCACACIVLECL